MSKCLVDGRFSTHYGLKSDIALYPKSAMKRHDACSFAYPGKKCRLICELPPERVARSLARDDRWIGSSRRVAMGRRIAWG